MSDLIKRSDAIEVAYQLRRKPNDDEWDWWLRSFNAIPSADRPSGEWMPKNSHTMYCDVCGFEEVEWRTQDYGYCPHCGARMKGADDESTDRLLADM